jgi:hypothetical protein
VDFEETPVGGDGIMEEEEEAVLENKKKNLVMKEEEELEMDVKPDVSSLAQVIVS